MTAQAPPDMPPKKDPTTMPEMLQSIRDETDMLERALAGYTHLTDILRQQTQGLQPGERMKGLPILAYRASADGVHAVDVRADLAKIDPAYVPHVLSPMANVHAAEMLDSLSRIYKYAGSMLHQVQAAMGYAQPEHPAVPSPQVQATQPDDVDAIEEAEPYQAQAPIPKPMPGPSIIPPVS